MFKATLRTLQIGCWIASFPGKGQLSWCCMTVQLLFTPVYTDLPKLHIYSSLVSQPCIVVSACNLSLNAKALNAKALSTARHNQLVNAFGCPLLPT